MLGEEEAEILMGEIHEGVCGAHQSAFKMKWMIRNNNYYRTTIFEYCFKYYKGCQECQKFGSIQRVPASAMNPIIKSWPFKGWVIDSIGQIYPLSRRGHKFVLVATDYFTKWFEAILIKTATSGSMINCLSVWYTSNDHNQSRKSIHLRGVRRICKFFRDQTVKLISLLCSGEWTGRGSEQGHH
jgi:hypothetical protein